ncbi:54S ribosomal protein L27 [Yarrowia sp. B02]|nr:54S ribosomal protein L27 [Yarrowia sp. B02]
MRPSFVTQLLRPWKKDRAGYMFNLFYGVSKNGNKRLPLTSKQGNKNFYKGHGAAGVGKTTSKGRYIINRDKVRTFVVPAGLESCDLKPFVSPTLEPIKNTFRGYTGPLDPKLTVKKVNEYVKTGPVVQEDSPDRKNWLEQE